MENKQTIKITTKLLGFQFHSEIEVPYFLGVDCDKELISKSMQNLLSKHFYNLTKVIFEAGVGKVLNKNK